MTTLKSRLQAVDEKNFNGRKHLKYPPATLDEIAEEEFKAGASSYHSIIEELAWTLEAINAHNKNGQLIWARQALAKLEAFLKEGERDA